jgi:histone deacetylase 6
MSEALEGFAITPRIDCPHVDYVEDQVINNPQHLESKISCDICGDESENWYCLTCERILCSRYVQGHMMQHATTGKGPENEHAICISFSDLSFWCFRCEDYIEDKVSHSV